MAAKPGAELNLLATLYVPTAGAFAQGHLLRADATTGVVSSPVVTPAGTQLVLTALSWHTTPGDTTSTPVYVRPATQISLDSVENTVPSISSAGSLGNLRTAVSMDGARWEPAGSGVTWTPVPLLNGATGELALANLSDGTTVLRGSINYTVAGVPFAELPVGSRTVSQAIIGNRSPDYHRAMLTYGGLLYQMYSAGIAMNINHFTFKTRVEPEVEPL